MTYRISQRMASLIRQDTGMTLRDIGRKGLHQIDSLIEKKIGRKIRLGFEPGHQGRGNVLIQEKRIIWPEDVDKLRK